ncbi:hypothetical protein KUTeg_001591 [Tegillarca granosa]|uniref:Tetratricopeptide repeat protein 36 n=1 Tax=Tegillarca granosa TaxID=220873 RepID=A0ABQ9FRV5_TEGGR|nr:hypothetical protein KUTeg_001591 [Tegillarca granosa]
MDQDPIVSPHDKAILQTIFNPSLPYGDVIEEEQQLSQEIVEIETDEVKQVKHLELEGVQAAESGDMQTALEQFNKAIQILPSRASGYNNRAQALRLKGDVKGALEDLDNALNLSGGQGSVACQAYTQRGLIKRLEGDDEGAVADFKIAASLGGQFAKQQVIAMNPYAALCNQMLAEVITKLRSGEGEP